ncbi:MAG: hypothetical protein HY904_20765 [Deltaproteobacteria bacterium]|nr:hypothetical protein [Deltaproteobacteria bacterium]
MSPAKKDRPRHAIADVVFSVLAPGKGAALVINADGEKILREKYAGYFDKPDLADATEELGVAAWFLEEKKNSPDASKLIYRLMNEAVPHLRRRGVKPSSIMGGDKLEWDSQEITDAKKMFKADAKGPDPRLGKSPDTALLRDLNAAKNRTRR